MFRGKKTQVQAVPGRAAANALARCARLQAARAPFARFSGRRHHHHHRNQRRRHHSRAWKRCFIAPPLLLGRPLTAPLYALKRERGDLQTGHALTSGKSSLDTSQPQSMQMR